MSAPGQIIEASWIALGLYWAYSARDVKNAVINESTSLRVFRFGMLVLVFALFANWLKVPLLETRFISLTLPVLWCGAALTVAGIALAIWARWRLGRNWSDKVVIKEDHELIRSGPYRFLRHPIYTGALLGIAGTALAIGEWRGVLAFVALSANYFVKAKREEALLAAQFGEDFTEHKGHTGFFLPGL